MKRRCQDDTPASRESKRARVNECSSDQADAKVEVCSRPPKSLQKRQRSINSRYWTHFRKKCNDWVVRTTPAEPSFCLLYWRCTRGHQEIIWEGPEHMRSFAENSEVLEVFKSAALSRVSLQEDVTASQPGEKQYNPIQLRSKNPCEYRNDVLAKIIPKILNPLGKRGNFYDDPTNCPQWFPKEKVKFRRPNHPKSGEKRMNVEEMRLILQAFFDNCSNHYIITSDKEEEFQKEKGSDEQAESPTDTDVEEGETAANIGVQMNMTSGQALEWCSSSEVWSEFESRVLKAAERVDTSFLSLMHLATVEQLNEKSIDWRRKKVLENVLPEEYIPCISTAEGNCLFCSVSLLLFGSEDYHNDLRFASVHYALMHFDHYYEMLKNEIRSVEDAQQFFATVVSFDTMFSQQSSSTVSEILESTLKTEIRSMSRIGCYSGLLQILFLSGVTKYAVQQHCEIDRDGYNTTLYPCACTDTIMGTIHIMWVKYRPCSATMNHIIPLLKKTNDGVTVTKNGSNLGLIQESLNYSLCLFCAHSVSEEVSDSDNMSMVQCETCSTWFHCTCIGVCVDHFDNGESFNCCITLPPEKNFQVVMCQRGRRKANLHLTDVQSLYPNKGVSDATIDFFVRILLPKEAGAMIASALGYTAIVRALDEKSSDLKTRFMNVNGPIDVSQPLILFPCCIKEAWHWILVAVYQSKEIAFVMDSLSPSVVRPYSNQAVESINGLLRCWNPNLTLKAVAYQVPLQQGSVDCGIHVMKHIQTISEMKNPAKTLLDNPTMLAKSVDAERLRKYILKQCSDHSKTLARRSRQKLMVRQSEAEKKEKKANEMAELRKKIEKKDTSSLEVVNIKGKGRGVKAKVKHEAGQFVCEYVGETLSYEEAAQREKAYLSKRKVYKGYMFYFKFKDKKMCIDATEEKTHVGRLINHSRKSSNLVPKLIDINGEPHIGFFSKCVILPGEEVVYDYGDISHLAVKAHPWLKL